MDETAGIDINRSPEEVWAFVSDLPRTPQWRPHLGAVRWLGEGDRGVGARFETVTTFLFWRNVRIVCEITQWEPPRQFRYAVVSGPIRADAAVGHPAPRHGIPLLRRGRHRGELAPGQVPRPLARPRYRRQTDAGLRRLKEALERGAPPPT